MYSLENMEEASSIVYSADIKLLQIFCILRWRQLQERWIVWNEIRTHFSDFFAVPDNICPQILSRAPPWCKCKQDNGHYQSYFPYTHPLFLKPPNMWKIRIYLKLGSLILYTLKHYICAVCGVICWVKWLCKLLSDSINTKFLCLSHGANYS